MAKKKKVAFVIAPIGEEDSEIRKRSDQILKHVIQPSVDECGYKAVRADKIEKPGVITSQVIQHVVEDVQKAGCGDYISGVCELPFPGNDVVDIGV